MRSQVSFLMRRFVCLNTIPVRAVHTSSRMAERYIEKLRNENPYYEKYAQKISKLQEAAPEKLEELVVNKNQNDKVEADTSNTRSFSAGAPKPVSSKLRQGKARELNSVIKLELIQDKTPDEIGKIWTEYFKTKDSVSAVIPAEKYQDIQENFNRFPTFLFPLPRDQGYEFVVAQAAGNEVHFTPLINFQAYKENAPECLTMVHYPELAADKGIVLMAAEYDNTSLNAREAQYLANGLQLYYCRPDARRRQLLETFTSSPDQFRYQDLIAALEDIQLQ